MFKKKQLTASQSPFFRVKIGTPPVAVKQIKCSDILRNHFAMEFVDASAGFFVVLHSVVVHAPKV